MRNKKYFKYFVLILIILVSVSVASFFILSKESKVFECNDSTKFSKVSPFEYQRDKEYIIETCKSFLETHPNSSWSYIGRLKDSITPIFFVDTISYSPDKMKFISIIVVKFYSREKMFKFNTLKSRMEYVGTEEGYFYKNFVCVGVRDSLNTLWDVYEVQDIFSNYETYVEFNSYYEAANFYRKLFYELMFKTTILTKTKVNEYKEYETDKSPIYVDYLIGHNVQSPCFWNSILWHKGIDYYEGYYKFQIYNITNNPDKSLHPPKELKKIVYPDTLIAKFK